jgi:hypothetical protein
MKPIFAGSVVTFVKPCFVRQAALPVAVYGFALRAPQPAATRATTASTAIKSVPRFT